MKVLALTTAILCTVSSAAATAAPTAVEDAPIEARAPGWGGFHWSHRGSGGGMKRDAEADAAPGWSHHGSGGGLKARDAEADAAPGWSHHGSGGGLKARDADAGPGWWGFHWSHRGSGGGLKARDADAAPGWWGFHWSHRGSGGGMKRDVGAADADDEDLPFIYLPPGMTPDDLLDALTQSKAEAKAAEPATTKE